MTIAKDFASKFAVAFVAIAMILVAIAPAVQAQETTEDLQTTINDLLAQVAALQGQLGDDEDTTSASCESIPAPLTVGSQGASVTMLQERLIADGQAIAAGATGYFGAQTKAALAGWQAANNVAPAAGYYGPITMAAMDAACVPADEDEDMDEDEEDEESGDLSGEGTLDTFEMDDADDTDVQEGSEDSEIAEITVEATDGDIEVDRMTFTLVGQSTPTEDEPWEVFDTISLWVDGEMVADFDASDEDNYLDEDTGEFRFSGLGLVLPEDEEVDIVVGASVQGSIDGAGTDAAWRLTATEVRYFDADGVAEDDDTTDELPTAQADFDIVEEGDGEELKFGLGDNNPDATDIIVDEDDSTNGVTILEYTIEAQEGDIELNTLFVKVDIGGDDYAGVVDDIMLVIDGEEFDDEDMTTFALGSTTVEFDIDGDVVIDEDSEVTVEVVVDFNSQSSNYDNGDTIKASVTSEERDATDAEGADDVTAFSGSAVGEDHTLVAEGIVVPVDGFSAEVDTLGQNDTIGEYTLEFEVTAIEGDFYITDNATTSTSVTDGVVFSIDPAAAGTVTSVLESTGDEDTSGVFTIEEGETETFTLTVTFDPAAAGSFRVQLDEIWYTANTNGTSSTDDYLPTPATDFRSASKAINQ